MATPLTAQGFRNIANRLAARGIKVRFYPGWETRGRPGTWGPTNGFIWHHTGSDSQSDSYLKFLFIDGRPTEGIPGPLCQFAIQSDGTVWIGARGRANHAGKGSSRTLNHVMAEDYSGYSEELTPGSDDIDGNARYLGVEIMYSGGHTMAAAQYKAATYLAAETMREFKWTALSCIGHREHSGRKWDPGKHNLAAMRRDTRSALALETEEDDMPYKDWPLEDRQQLCNDVTKYVFNKLLVSAHDGKEYPFHSYVRYDNKLLHDLAAATKRDAISQAVTQALDAQPDVDVDETAVAAALIPLITAAIELELAEFDQVDEAAVADGVIARLSAALAAGANSGN